MRSSSASTHLRRVLATAIAAGATAVAPLAAQTAVDRAPRPARVDLPEWALRWSPLSIIADHPRALPAAPEAPSSLLLVEQSVGLLWVAGNPGALPFEVGSRWNLLQVARSGAAGKFRRPMEEDGVRVTQFLAAGWERVGGGGAAAGRVVVDDERVSLAPFADLLEPHSTSPLMLADSSFPALRRVRARLEGAFGWRFGQWGVGVAAGTEVRDHRTRDAPFARIGRLAEQGVAVGVVRAIPLAGLRAGVHARWVPGSETVTLFPEPAPGTAYVIHGYAEPLRASVASPGSFFRRVERDAWLWGIAARGDVAGFQWAGGWESTRRRDAHFSEQRADPAKDRWSADGWTLFGAVSRWVLPERLLAVARIRHSDLHGEATRADLRGVVFRATEEVTGAAADVIYRPPGSPWEAALRFGLVHDLYFRRDFVAGLRSLIESWRPGGALEVTRRLGAATELSVSYGLAFHSTLATIPNPSATDSVYRLLFAPELAAYATPARPWRVGAGVSHDLGEEITLVLRAWRESLAPSSEANLPPPAPMGERSIWRVSLSLILREQNAPPR